MSSRVLRKLHGDKDSLPLGAEAAGLGSESDDGGSSGGAKNHTAAHKKQLAANRFELLNSVEHSLSDTEAKEDDDRENEPPADQERNKLEKQDSTHSTDSLKRRKKKKKKKMRSQKSLEDNLGNPEDEVEASIREVNKILGEASAMPHQDSATQEDAVGRAYQIEKSLLSVDHRNLNPDNEMRRIFGSKVVQAEQARKRGRGRSYGRSSVLVNPRNWPHVGKPGISMTLLETKGDIQYFTFEHSKQYQAVQFQFLDAVESINPDNIVGLLNMHPYHIDSLIQFSDICKMGEDYQMASELIERALYCCECSFHPLFNVTQGNCRLDYRRPENRSFFIALFKHLSFVGQRGCNRTAFEFCKLLLGLDPEEDPLAVTLMIDYYALRSEQYEYLIRFFQEWDADRNLSQLPNFAFSVPLAMFHHQQNQPSDSKNLSQADKMLQNSLIMFPGLLMPLLDKCGIHPDAHVSKHPFFGPKAETSQPAGLSQLISLYIGRCHLLWKDAIVVPWLERNVKEVLLRVDARDPFVAECEEKRRSRYKGMPRNVLRHIILSGIKEATATLPPELSSTPIFGFDPLPPADSIVTYTRLVRQRTVEEQSMLGVFFRSLLPNFHMPQEGVLGGAVPQAREGGAVGEDHAHRSDTTDLRRSFTSLVDAMRDLLSNIHMVDAPNEGDVDSDEDEHND